MSKTCPEHVATWSTRDVLSQSTSSDDLKRLWTSFSRRPTTLPTLDDRRLVTTNDRRSTTDDGRMTTDGWRSTTDERRATTECRNIVISLCYHSMIV